MSCHENWNGNKTGRDQGNNSLVETSNSVGHIVDCLSRRSNQANWFDQPRYNLSNYIFLTIIQDKKLIMENHYIYTNLQRNLNQSFVSFFGCNYYMSKTENNHSPNSNIVAWKCYSANLTFEATG